MASDALIKAINKYQAKNVKQLQLKFHVRIDADVIARLDEQESKAGYIKRLIREDIARGKASEVSD